MSRAALVNLRWYWTWPPLRWMWQRALAGGQLVDQSIHLLDVSRGLVGEIETVYAAYSARQANHEPEFDNLDGYAVTLHYRGGAVGVSAKHLCLVPGDPGASARGRHQPARPPRAYNRPGYSSSPRAACRSGPTRSRCTARSTACLSPPCALATSGLFARRCAPGCYPPQWRWRPITRRRRDCRSPSRRLRRPASERRDEQPGRARGRLGGNRPAHF